MSWKSIRFSIYTIILYCVLLFGVAFLFSINVVLGFVGVVLWIVIPMKIRNKAVDEASGVFDKILAKYIVPIIAALLVLGIILYFIFGSATGTGIF